MVKDKITGVLNALGVIIQSIGMGLIVGMIISWCIIISPHFNDLTSNDKFFSILLLAFFVCVLCLFDWQLRMIKRIYRLTT